MPDSHVAEVNNSALGQDVSLDLALYKFGIFIIYL